MTKKDLIDSILQNSKIHHNISTLGIKLPEAPEDMPESIFETTCSDMIEFFTFEWEDLPINDSGNRNLCGCNATIDEEERKPDNSNIKRPDNILKNGACKKHDFYHIYSHGRMGATLYWDKYWEESNTRDFYFKYEPEDLEELGLPELITINSEIKQFNTKVKQMMTDLPAELRLRYTEWSKQNKEEKRREALGYNRTLGELLGDDNPQIIRLAKGIKKELNK